MSNKVNIIITSEDIKPFEFKPKQENNFLPKILSDNESNNNIRVGNNFNITYTQHSTTTTITAPLTVAWQMVTIDPPEGEHLGPDYWSVDPVRPTIESDTDYVAAIDPYQPEQQDGDIAGVYISRGGRRRVGRTHSMVLSYLEEIGVPIGSLSEESIEQIRRNLFNVGRINPEDRARNLYEWAEELRGQYDAETLVWLDEIEDYAEQHRVAQEQPLIVGTPGPDPTNLADMEAIFRGHAPREEIHSQSLQPEIEQLRMQANVMQGIIANQQSEYEKLFNELNQSLNAQGLPFSSETNVGGSGAIGNGSTNQISNE